jgi:AraC-like DNA-binding protein
MARNDLFAALPHGVPTYSLRHGRYLWKPGTKPVPQLFTDWDVFWIRRGAALWELKDGRRLIGRTNELVVMPPYVPALLSELEPTLEFWYCHFAFRLPPQRISVGLRQDFAGPDEALLPLSFTAAAAPGVASAYRALTRLRFTDGAAPWRLERALIALVSELASFARARPRVSATKKVVGEAPRDPRLTEVCTRVEAEPAHPWRVAELAASVGLSTSRMHALCRAAHGVSLKAYIVRTRLQRAVGLLRERRQGALPSIREVGEACGFSSQHFFSRQFKSFYGVSPLAYRNTAVLA